MEEKLKNIRQSLKDGVSLIAVSKTKPMEMIKEAYDLGQRDFGENKVQELREKIELLPSDIRWHLIGALQRNKVKYLDERTYLIHSVDRIDLLKEISKNGDKKGYIPNILLEINIGREENKAGVLEEDLKALVEEAKRTKNVNVRGLMTVLPICDEAEQRVYFKKMKGIFDDLKKEEEENFKMEILSMGMSGDYMMAMEEGANMVRIGSKIFGERDYSKK